MTRFGSSGESSWATSGPRAAQVHYGDFGPRRQRPGRYAALIGDVVGSRRIDERAAFQTRLRERLEALNRRFAPALAGPLVLLRGDEVQGLFVEPAAAVAVVVELADTLFPVEFAYGLGYGELSTDLLPETSQMDGPCFHRAREGVEKARKDQSWLRAAGFGALSDTAISALFELMKAVRSRWTERQNEFVRAARSELQKDVAARFGVSPSVVSESLKAACFQAVLEGEAAVTACLQEFTAGIEVLDAVAQPTTHYGGFELS